jgi:hypothetical protein
MPATIAPQTAITQYQEAVAKLEEAEVSQTNAQHAYEGALNAKNTADGNAAAAVDAYNRSIDTVVEALTAAKRTPAAVPKAA